MIVNEFVYANVVPGYERDRVQSGCTMKAHRQSELSLKWKAIVF